MTKIRAAVVGYGNIGRFSIEALEAAPDFEIAGVVRRNVAEIPAELAPYKVVTDIRELGHVDVAILATPTREVEKYALEYPAMGINTVDSFDIHTSIIGLRRSSMPQQKGRPRGRYFCRMGSGKRFYRAHTP